MKIKNKKMVISNEEIRQKIVDSLNLSNLEKSKQDKVISIFLNSVSLRISIAVWDKLSEKDKSKISKIIKLGSKEFLNYINSHVSNFTELVENITRQTIHDFRKIMVKINLT